jgi:hypothetical protein
VKNEKTWDKNFNWFDKEHYEYTPISAGSRKTLLKFFNENFLHTWSNRKFGTTLQDIRKTKRCEWLATISRFKTAELCKKHCNFPSTFERTGDLL